MYGKKELKKLVFSQETEDSYILDDENAFIVIENIDRNTHSNDSSKIRK